MVLIPVANIENKHMSSRMVDKGDKLPAPLLNPEKKYWTESHSCQKFTWLEGSSIVVKVFLRVSWVIPHLVRISASARSNSIIWEVAEEIELGDRRKIGLTTSHQLPLIFCSNNSIPIDLYWTFGVLNLKYKWWWNVENDLYLDPSWPCSFCSFPRHDFQWTLETSDMI